MDPRILLVFSISDHTVSKGFVSMTPFAAVSAEPPSARTLNMGQSMGGLCTGTSTHVVCRNPTKGSKERPENQKKCGKCRRDGL